MSQSARAGVASQPTSEKESSAAGSKSRPDTAAATRRTTSNVISTRPASRATGPTLSSSRPTSRAAAPSASSARPASRATNATASSPRTASSRTAPSTTATTVRSATSARTSDERRLPATPGSKSGAASSRSTSGGLMGSKYASEETKAGPGARTAAKTPSSSRTSTTPRMSTATLKRLSNGPASQVNKDEVRPARARASNGPTPRSSIDKTPSSKPSVARDSVGSVSSIDASFQSEVASKGESPPSSPKSTQSRSDSPEYLQSPQQVDGTSIQSPIHKPDDELGAQQGNSTGPENISSPIEGQSASQSGPIGSLEDKARLDDHTPEQTVVSNEAEDNSREAQQTEQKLEQSLLPSHRSSNGFDQNSAPRVYAKYIFDLAVSKGNLHIPEDEIDDTLQRSIREYAESLIAHKEINSYKLDQLDKDSGLHISVVSEKAIQVNEAREQLEALRESLNSKTSEIEKAEMTRKNMQSEIDKLSAAAAGAESHGEEVQKLQEQIDQKNKLFEEAKSVGSSATVEAEKLMAQNKKLLETQAAHNIVEQQHEVQVSQLRDELEGLKKEAGQVPGLLSELDMAKKVLKEIESSREQVFERSLESHRRQVSSLEFELKGAREASSSAEQQREVEARARALAEEKQNGDLKILQEKVGKLEGELKAADEALDVSQKLAKQASDEKLEIEEARARESKAQQDEVEFLEKQLEGMRKSVKASEQRADSEAGFRALHERESDDHLQNLNAEVEKLKDALSAAEKRAEKEELARQEVEERGDQALQEQRRELADQCVQLSKELEARKQAFQKLEEFFRADEEKIPELEAKVVGLEQDNAALRDAQSEDDIKIKELERHLAKEREVSQSLEERSLELENALSQKKHSRSFSNSQYQKVRDLEGALADAREIVKNHDLLSKQLQDMEISLTQAKEEVKDHETLSNKLKETELALAQAQEGVKDYEILSNRLKEMELSLAQAQEEVKDHEGLSMRLQDMELSLTEAQEKVKDHESLSDKLKETELSLTQAREQVTDHEALSNRLQEAELALAQAKKDNEGLKEQSDTRAMIEAEAEASGQADTEALLKKVEDLETDLETAKSSSTTFEAKSQQLAAQIDRLIGDRKNIQFERDQFEEDKDRIERKLTDITSALSLSYGQGMMRLRENGVDKESLLTQARDHSRSSSETGFSLLEEINRSRAVLDAFSRFNPADDKAGTDGQLQALLGMGLPVPPGTAEEPFIPLHWKQDVSRHVEGHLVALREELDKLMMYMALDKNHFLHEWHIAETFGHLQVERLQRVSDNYMSLVDTMVERIASKDLGLPMWDSQGRRSRPRSQISSPSTAREGSVGSVVFSNSGSPTVPIAPANIKNELPAMDRVMDAQKITDASLLALANKVRSIRSFQESRASA